MNASAPGPGRERLALNPSPQERGDLVEVSNAVVEPPVRVEQGRDSGDDGTTGTKMPGGPKVGRTRRHRLVSRQETEQHRQVSGNWRGRAQWRQLVGEALE